MKAKSLLENRKEVLKLQISDTQEQIDSLLRTILNRGVYDIHSNTVNMVMPNLIQAQHRLSQLEVEFHTLNAYDHYKEDEK
ncbi:hypothetical protein [Bacillus phage vB_BanS-Thrax3]|nr:hypothetical protein [Bacillus phage vB_BanS-Thrax3]